MKQFFVACSLLALTVLGYSCKCSRTTEDTTPKICPSSSFVASPITATSSSTPINVNEGVTFSSTFNEIAQWKLVVKATSGAYKSFEGKSNNVQVIWYGDAQSEVFFAAGDAVSVDLFVSCKDEPLSSEGFNIGIATDFTKVGVLCSDFDQGIVPPNNYNFTPRGLVTLSMSDYHPSPNGGSYFNITGTSPTPVWYFDGFGLDWSSSTPPAFLNTAKLHQDPSKVYLNVLVSSGASTNSQYQLTVSEKYNGALKQRKFVKDITWTGWKVVTVKLSDIGILDPTQIKTIAFGLGAAKTQQLQGELNIDLVLLTNDHPLQY